MTRLESSVSQCDACLLPRLRSVLVLRHGRPVYEGYWNGADAATLHDTQSAMKSVTALAVGIAVGEGKIRSVDEPAFAFLPDLAPFANDGPLKQGITIADLLTMSSALDCDDDDVRTAGNELKIEDLRAVVVVTTENFNQPGMFDQTIRLLEDHVFPALPCAAGAVAPNPTATPETSRPATP